MEARLWPLRAEANQLLRNLEKVIPGLTVRYNKAGEEIPLPIQTQLMQKMRNDNRNRLAKIRISEKSNASSNSAPRAGRARHLMPDAKKRKLSDVATEEFEDFDTNPLEEDDSSLNGTTSTLSKSEYFSGPEDELVDFYTG